MDGSGAKGFDEDWRKEGEEERVSHGMEVSGSGRMDDDGGLIGVYVCKNTSRVRFLLGKVLSYNGTSRLYRVLYEDGQQEDLERELVCEMVRMDGGAGKLTQRKRRLDRIVPTGGLSMRTTRSRKGTHNVDISVGQVSSEVISVDADSPSDYCDHARFSAAAESSSFLTDTHVIPLELPPSSGDIAVPEGSISYLFSTYSFLRTFSLQLFLSPFGFDDYVGSLNCSVQNSLMDSIHFSLMRALRRHLKELSNDGSIVASKCLRLYDWTLLDMLTWPAFLSEYLFVMGYLKEMESKEFILSVLNGEYYCLNVATKLKVLQILCDDVINSKELRTVIGMRAGIEEDNEEGLDAYISSQDELTSLHSEISKSSSLKDQINSKESIFHESQHIDTLVSEADIDGSANSQDKNSDECCLCGMDGILICCDGCPSSFHSRCIGLNKASLPKLWFCPECNINKIGPTSRIRKGTGGAEVFGTDTHGRIFVGTCNYLLVLGSSMNEYSISRYYNLDDILKVLSVISSTQENTLAYVDIRKGISEYFEVSLPSLKADISDSMRDILANKEGGALCYFANTPSRNSTDIINNSGENIVSSIITSNSMHSDSVAKDDVTVDPTSYVMNQAGNSDAQTIFKENDDICANKIPAIADEMLVPSNIGNLMSGMTDPLFLSKHIKTWENHGFGSVAADLSSSNPSMPSKLIFVNNFSLSSGNEFEICKEEADSSIYLTKDGLGSACYESQDLLNKCNVAHKNTSTVTVSFKPMSYINQYIQGDIAASAAESLAVLSTTDSKFASAHGSSNQKKLLTATFELQLKAFSVAVMNFLWPYAEKKLMDVPRERCCWCIACKGLTTYKKGCLLNLAASNAIKGPARNCNLRASKHHESHLPVIAVQLLIMKESLRGLMVGESLNEHDEWCKRVREASSCSILKLLVLQLEKNIRRIAFSSGWTKMMDDLSENYKSPNGVSRTGGIQKRGRKSKKQSEIILASSDDNCKDFQWWRGGKLSKAILQTCSIPSSLARKAARLGGIKRIFGISYHECSKYHQRSRQFAWRAAVERSKSTSQLALQVRYLDAHIRWKEFTRLEQVPMDIKGSDTDVLVFRNAFICDKRILENNILYALNFGNQKHLSLRVKKTILQSEKDQNGNEKLWFSEDHIPLYLIKEYEENVCTYQILPTVSMMPNMMHNMPKFFRRQLEIYWGDVFTYLTCKRDNPGKCLFCQNDVCLRYAVKCKGCQEYCHLHCSMPSVAQQIGDCKLSRMCKLCYSAKSPEPLESSQSSRKPLLLRLPVPNMSNISQTRPHSTSVSYSKTENSDSLSFFPTSINERKTKSSGGKWFTHGIIWRRKKHDSEDGKNFLMENILFKGSNSSKNPVCCLCQNPYNSNLMYVCCEKCKKWYHADAVLLYEDKVLDVVGFKCCKCRRKTSPECPYFKGYFRDLEETSRHDKVVETGYDMQVQLKSGSSTTSFSNSESENFGMEEFDTFLHPFARDEPDDEDAHGLEDNYDTSFQSYDGQQMHSENLDMVEFDSYPHSFAKDEPVDESSLEMEDKYNAFIQQTSNGRQNYTENFATVKFDPNLHAFVKDEAEEEAAYEMEDNDAFMQSFNSQQKLSIRRSQVNPKGFENPTYKASPGAEILQNIEVDVHDIKFENSYDEEADMGDNMEFEPQTYFSFTELLASEDDGPMDLAEHQGVLNDYRGIYSDMSVHNLNKENEIAECKEFTFDGIACQKCKLFSPSPNLICHSCRLCIHSHCSPWVEEGIEASTESKWRCGNCREWR